MASFDQDDSESSSRPSSGSSSPIWIYVGAAVVCVGVTALVLAAQAIRGPRMMEARRQRQAAEALSVQEAFPDGTVDLAAELPRARAAAQAVIPNALLTALRAKNVRPNGHADLSSEGEVVFEFVAPPGEALLLACALKIRYTAKHGRQQETSTLCNSPPLPSTAPQCTYADVWREVARRNGSDPGLISLTLKVFDENDKGRKQAPKPMWEVDAVGGPWLGRFADDCTH